MPVFKSVFKLFAESTKEHQVGSILCTACNPRPTIHQGCSLSGLIHTETFPEEPTTADFSITHIVGDNPPVRLPTAEPVIAVSLTVCDKCGKEL
ncbi:MAG TPA: hypothetical protein VK638_30360 [Edaphobacter sp.]|nr:hypothetical protein [Edaphobacter sp.]